MLIHAYLDAAASTKNLSDLKAAFETFARRKGHRISSFYNDQEPPEARSNLFRLLRDKGLAIASQPEPSSPPQYESSGELFRLLGEARPNDVLLIESVALLGGLAEPEWTLLRQKIRQRKLRLVSLDVEASWVMVTSESAMTPVAEQLTAIMLDMLEAVPKRKRQEETNRRLKGIAKARAKGKYKGRPVDRNKHQHILSLLNAGYSWSEVCAETGASRSTVARVVKASH